jgi:hypothetical protein
VFECNEFVESMHKGGEVWCGRQMNKKNRVGTREGVGRVAGVLRKVLTFTALARRRPSFLGDSAPGRRRSVRCSSHVSGEARKRGSTFVSVIMLYPSTRPPESAPASLVLYYKTPSPVPISDALDFSTCAPSREDEDAHTARVKSRRRQGFTHQKDLAPPHGSQRIVFYSSI